MVTVGTQTSVRFDVVGPATQVIDLPRKLGRNQNPGVARNQN